MGYTGYGVYCRFQNVTIPTKEKILESLKKNPHVYWIAEFGGRYDLAFAIMARNIIEFNEIFTELTTEHQKYIKDPTIAIRAELIEFPRKYLAKTEEQLNNHPRFGKFIEAEKLDATDKNILRKITQHPRESILEISKKIAVSPATARARLKDLEKRQIIQGYGAKINCQQFGYQSYQLFITAHNLTKENKKRLISYCEHHPNIIFYIETVGRWQFEIIYELEDQKKLQECVIEMRTLFQEMILDIESIVLFDHYVKYNQFPFSPQEK